MVRPKDTNTTLAQAVDRYQKYIKKKGVASEGGNQPIRNVTTTVKETKSDVALRYVKQGKPYSWIIQQDGMASMARVIKALMDQAPARTFRTYCQHIWGPSYQGKTTTLKRILGCLRECYGVEYFKKGGGLSKWWDGYDYQPICWIEDPGGFKDGNGIPQMKDVENFKRLISDGECQMEVKFGTVQFRSYLVVIDTNPSPEGIADKLPLHDQEAILNRINSISARSIHFCGGNRKRFEKQLCKNIFKLLAHNQVVHGEWRDFYLHFDRSHKYVADTIVCSEVSD